jgi:glutathione S-transferase
VALKAEPSGKRTPEERNVNIKLYSAKGCPFARRTRVILHEKGIDFETREVDFRNKSEEFLEASPTGKVPVIVVDGDSLYESNIVNQFLDEVYEEPKLMPGDPKARAYARIWMARADDDFYPQVFVSGMGRERGFSEERISEALEKLKATLSRLEGGLEGREYLAGPFSLADVAHAGNFVRLRELEERGEISLTDYPNVASWMGRIEARESFKAAA